MDVRHDVSYCIAVINGQLVKKVTKRVNSVVQKDFDWSSSMIWGGRCSVWVLPCTQLWGLTPDRCQGIPQTPAIISPASLIPHLCTLIIHDQEPNLCLSIWYITDPNVYLLLQVSGAAWCSNEALYDWQLVWLISAMSEPLYENVLKGKEIYKT